MFVFDSLILSFKCCLSLSVVVVVLIVCSRIVHLSFLELRFVFSNCRLIVLRECVIVLCVFIAVFHCVGVC